jgi:hypothetical protein
MRNERERAATAPDIGHHGRNPAVGKDYSKADPDEIVADIERTRAHMDETLALLGRKLRPKVPRQTLRIASWIAGGLLIAGLAYRTFGPPRRHRHHRNRKASSRWREARLWEQAMLAGKLAQAARKGKPAIIVVEPRKV